MTHRSRALALYALACYVLSVAIVPAGFMAAPVESGAAFHLCPGDARSAQIIDAFDGGDPHHHHHHAQQQYAAPSADLDCGFAVDYRAVLEKHRTEKHDEEKPQTIEQAVIKYLARRLAEAKSGHISFEHYRNLKIFTGL